MRARPWATLRAAYALLSVAAFAAAFAVSFAATFAVSFAVSFCRQVVSGQPDPKRRRRGRDGPALARARSLYLTCAVCGAGAGSIHHVVPRSRGGDDDVANLVGLCGHGSGGCHGAVHGSPYTRDGRRVEPADARRALLRHLLAARPDVVAYAEARAGPGWLERRYGVLKATREVE